MKFANSDVNKLLLAGCVITLIGLVPSLSGGLKDFRGDETVLLIGVLISALGLFLLSLGLGCKQNIEESSHAQKSHDTNYLSATFPY